ncbi:MAG: arginine repressor [Clostridiales bacterium]|nr:arginine repressor [Clostridiales bacterium]
MKNARQNKIIELVNANEIETQEELLELLKNEGYQVTQATISRDIRELKLTKISEGGKQIYRPINQSETDYGNKYIQILKSGFIYMEMAQNIVVIKTVAGMAMAVAAAIDAMGIDDIVGCIAGDDTIMCAVKTVEDAPKVMDRINQLISSKQDNKMFKRER